LFAALYATVFFTHESDHVVCRSRNQPTIALAVRAEVLVVDKHLSVVRSNGHCSQVRDENTAAVGMQLDGYNGGSRVQA